MLAGGKLNTNRWDNIVSCMMQKEVKCYEMDYKKVSEKFGNSADYLEISAEGNKQYMSTRINGNTEKIPFYDIEEMGKEAWEDVTGLKVLYYLESSNIAGTEASVFQRYQHNQYKVFQQFLEDNNAYYHMNPENRERYDSMLKDITKAMDQYGEGGYNGISGNSMLLSQNMIAQLEHFNTNYVPDYLQDDFQRLIDECDYFNQNSREKMFADRMPCDIVTSIKPGGRLLMKEKSTVIRNYLEYSRQEKEKISETFLALRGKRSFSDICSVLQDIEKQYDRKKLALGGKNIFLSMKSSWKKLI